MPAVTCHPRARARPDSVHRLWVVLLAPSLFVALCAPAPERMAPPPKAPWEPPAPAGAPAPAYLGVVVEPADGGKLKLIHVEPDSPAGRAGLRVDDLLTQIGETNLARPDDLHAALRACAPGQKVRLSFERPGEAGHTEAALATPSRPFGLAKERAWLGVETEWAGEDAEWPGWLGQRVVKLAPGSPAAEAGVRVGDILTELGGSVVTDHNDLRIFLWEREPHTKVPLKLLRRGSEMIVTVTLGKDPSGEPVPVPKESPRAPVRRERWWSVLQKFDIPLRTVGPVPVGLGELVINPRLTGVLKWPDRPTLRLAVVPVAFPDAPLNPRITADEWREVFFSTGTYSNKASATGQEVHGSVNDYFREGSYGKLKVTGAVLDPVTLPHKTDHYSWFADFLVQDVKSILERREGKDRLKDFDAFGHLVAGRRGGTLSIVPTAGDLHPWAKPGRAPRPPLHRWPYVFSYEGGARMRGISVLVHETGHLLGLPDLYSTDPEVEGVNRWCTMSSLHYPARPLHYSAWIKEQLGWLDPVVLDPAVKQKLVLRPVREGPRACFKIPLGPDGGEYLLLENRVRQGFDRDLQAEGLFIWRVRDGWPTLEESHGIPGPLGPTVFLSAVTYPSAANTAYTPDTTPSSRPAKPGGVPVHITNIRRLPDGGIAFWLGYELY